MNHAAFTPLYVETIGTIGTRPVRLVWGYQQALDIALLEMALELIHQEDQSSACPTAAPTAPHGAM